MATKSWTGFYARCPFFSGDDPKQNVIYCEGLTDTSGICLGFRSREEYLVQLETFCKNHCEYCEIYHAIGMAKYMTELGWDEP